MARPRRTVPWLELRGSTFYIFWYDSTAQETKRLSLRTADAVEAQTAFGAFLLEGVTDPKPRGLTQLTVANALDDYFHEHVVRNVADVGRQEDAIAHLKTFFGDTPLSRVDVPVGNRYVEARRTGVIGSIRFQDRRGSDSTIRRELGVLIAAGNHALKWKRITPAELPRVERPKERVISVDEETLFYTKDEVDALIGMSVGELRWFIELAYYTGARRASIEDLERSQVRWDRKQIVLQKPTKRPTKKRQPIVPILKAMEPALTALWEKGGERRLFHTRSFFYAFSKLCGELGLEDRARPHLLRHSRATHLLQDGKSVYDVARLLGDTPATIMRVYGHHTSESLLANLEE